MAADEHTTEQGWPSRTVHRRYRPLGLGGTPQELCKALGCKSQEKVRQDLPFCKKHRAEYKQMMAAPAIRRHLFSTWV